LGLYKQIKISMAFSKIRLTFLLFINLLILQTGCQKSDDGIDKIIITGINDYVEMGEEVILIAKAITGTDTSEIPVTKWITSDDGFYTLTGRVLTPKKLGKSKISCQYKKIISEKYFEILEPPGGLVTYNFRIDNLTPPTDYYQIPEGNCGESILWTICHYFGKNLSQEEINKIGGDPGRGLHGNEVVDVLDSLKIKYRDWEKASTWESTVDTLKSIIIRGNPVLLGVKIYPDQHPNWVCDHFILLTGTDIRSNIFYYNNISSIETISYAKLCNTQKGYSLINKYNAMFALEILLTH
jgi:hypothetical protein